MYTFIILNLDTGKDYWIVADNAYEAIGSLPEGRYKINSIIKH